MRPIGGIARPLVIVQIVSVVVAAIALVAQLAASGAAQDFLDGFVSRSEFEDDLAPFNTVSLISGLITVAALVLLIIWTHRIARNLQSLVRQPQTWKPGLTIVVWLLGGCTLSIVNFFMLRELWRGSDPELPAGDSRWRQAGVSPLITTWFVLTLVQAVASALVGAQTIARSFGGGVGFDNDTEAVAESLTSGLPAVILAGLAGIAATVVLIMIIRQLSARHMRLTAEA
jgi:hypothetical protein